MTYRMTPTHCYFWGSYFSQWARTPFSAPLPQIHDTGAAKVLTPKGTMSFKTAEQFMMASKASLMGDMITLQEILDEDDPAKCKQMGRKVQNFDQALWDKYDMRCVTIGTYAKFTQHDAARAFLKEVGKRVIVEGSPQDKIWGVGLHFDDPLIEDETNWKGANKLGKVIMAIRDIIDTDGEQLNPWNAAMKANL